MQSHSPEKPSLWAFIALSVGFAMVIMDATIVNIALPSMARSLHSTISDLQWIVDSYTLTFACLLLFAGSLADKFGPRRIFLQGLVFFTIASVCCGLARNFLWLTFFRFWQGMAAALIIPSSLSLIQACYHTKAARAKAIGAWGSVGSLAATAGPIIGALLTSAFGWQVIFFANLPIGLLGIFLVTKHVPVIPPHGKTHFDPMGQMTIIISIAALAFGLIEAGRLGWSSMWVISSLILFLFMGGLFLVIEKKIKNPMLPLYFFKSPSFSVAILGAFIFTAALYGSLFLLPLYFQQVRHYSILMTALAILPLLAVGLYASRLSGKVSAARGPKLTLIIGFSLGAIGFLGLLMMNAHGPVFGLIMLPLLMMGFGCSFIMPALAFTAMHTAPHGRSGIAAAIVNSSRQVGSLVGVAIFGTLLNMFPPFVTGMHVAFILSAVAFIAQGILWSLIQPSHTPPH